MNVKTPHGTSQSYTLTDRIMQGDTWAPAMASAQVDSFGKQMIEEEPSFMFMFKDVVPIPLLGQVDDLIGVAEAGVKTHQLNAFVNVKTANKDLQFGEDKCKYMIVSKKKPESFLHPNIKVDQWKVEHMKNNNVIDHFVGKTNIKEEKSLMYLGHMLSQNGDNMPNIINIRNKSIGTQKKILNLIEPMGPYRFEGAIIYVLSLLRNSILYASETMCNIKEKELRAVENIEEAVLKKIFKTKFSCPWHLLYLEAGIIPARYQIHRQILVFLQYILQQPKDSLMHKVFEAEKRNPSKGDWVSSVTTLMNRYKIELTFLQIEDFFFLIST